MIAASALALLLGAAAPAAASPAALRSRFDDPTAASAAAFHADSEFHNTIAVLRAAGIPPRPTVGAQRQLSLLDVDSPDLDAAPAAAALSLPRPPRRTTVDLSLSSSSADAAGVVSTSQLLGQPPRVSTHGRMASADAAAPGNAASPIARLVHEPELAAESLALAGSAVERPSTSSDPYPPSAKAPLDSSLQDIFHPALSEFQAFDTLSDAYASPVRTEFVPDASSRRGLDYDRVAQAFEKQASSAPSRFATSRYMFYSEATGVVRAPSFEDMDLKKFGRPVRDLLEEGPFWLDVCQPTAAEMASISRAFGIHPLTDEDIQTPDTREKCEVFNSYYFVVIRSFDQDHSSTRFLTPIPVYIVIFRECIVSFQFRANPHANNVLNRIDQLQAYGLHVTTDWINYALIDDITDSFIPPIKFIELEVDNIDELVLILKESEQTDMLRRIGHARKQVTQLMRLLATKADVVKMVINRCMERLAPDSETRLYLEDIHDHVITMNQNLLHSEKTLARSHSNYLAQISIEITQASNRTSDVVMRMTALASILVPLNVVTGLWGMNVPVPGGATEDPRDLRWFFAILSSMVLLAALFFYIVRRAKLV
nr:CorA metal ion transporter [Polyrhizophydium stewartii]